MAAKVLRNGPRSSNPRPIPEHSGESSAVTGRSAVAEGNMPHSMECFENNNNCPDCQLEAAKAEAEANFDSLTERLKAYAMEIYFEATYTQEGK